MKVVGDGKVHANILKKNSDGKLETQVAGFTKLSSSQDNDLYGAYLAVSESITSYVRYCQNIHKPNVYDGCRLKAGESLYLGMGRDKADNSIAAVKSGFSQSVHFTVQKLV